MGFVSHGRRGLEDRGKLGQCGHCDYIQESCPVCTMTSSFGEKSRHTADGACRHRLQLSREVTVKKILILYVQLHAAL